MRKLRHVTLYLQADAVAAAVVDAAAPTARQDNVDNVMPALNATTATYATSLAFGKVRFIRLRPSVHAVLSRN